MLLLIITIIFVIVAIIFAAIVGITVGVAAPSGTGAGDRTSAAAVISSAVADLAIGSRGSDKSHR